ncbi:hypothetical protein Taro_036955 [Colocasia esculenta]|uniref:RNase H type-1 domain-containing protein n=1 Tax=Colocasia esculenta TaxID=4460 RepID=A0A843WEV0_COLES|nr:hypothetical protein [Colocasia esculenta]
MASKRALKLMNTRWVLGNGSRIRFLDDVWFGELPIRETASYALQEPSPSVREVRNHGIIRLLLQKIWHHRFSRRASIFSWLILHRAVPVDDRIAECGVPLPSRCSCCRSPQVEDLNHLFVFSDLAKDLWQWFSPFLQAGIDTNMNISIRLWDIISSCSIANPHGFISIYSTMLIIWEIWKIRCKMKFDQVACSSIKLRQNIHNLVNITLDKLVFKSSATAHQLHLIREFGFSAQFPVKVVKLVRWNPPLHGLLLNVDGASKGNPGPCGGGGIIRDSTATMRLAFSHFYGVGSSLLAEVRAMCDGVQMALGKGFGLAEISTDSMTLVDSFQSGTPPSWECSRWWWTVYYFLQQSQVPVKHVYREANQTGDALANLACNFRGQGHKQIVTPPKFELRILLSASPMPACRLSLENILPPYGAEARWQNPPKIRKPLAAFVGALQHELRPRNQPQIASEKAPGHARCPGEWSKKKQQRTKEQWRAQGDSSAHSGAAAAHNAQANSSVPERKQQHKHPRPFCSSQQECPFQFAALQKKKKTKHRFVSLPKNAKTPKP